MNSPTIIHSRVVVIGDSSVGKTSILNKLAYNNFNQNEPSTVGSNYQLFIHQIQDVKIELQIWDTAGQERFRSLGAIYFRNADAAIAVYDITRRNSFNGLEKWINEFIDVAGHNTTVFIVANKCDLENIDIPMEEAEAWANSKNYPIFKTSAKTGEGVKELFSDLSKAILDNQMSNSSTIHVQPKQLEESNQQQSCC